MNNRYRRVLVLSVLSLVVASAAYAGGWAILTVGDLPDYAVAGKPLKLVFMVRQHGETPLDGLEPKLEAKAGNRTTKAKVVPTGKTGEYAATFVPPQAGDWTIRIENGFDSVGTTFPLRVLAPGSAQPAALSPVVRGERLFVAKGCMDCHQSYGVGPDLTGKRFPDAYLQAFLADPAATLGRDSATRGEMPNLGLKQNEIAALAAFINREKLQTTPARQR